MHPNRPGRSRAGRGVVGGARAAPGLAPALREATAVRVKSSTSEKSVGLGPKRVPPAAHIMFGYGAHDGTVPIADAGR